MWLYNLGLHIYALIVRLVASRNRKAQLWHAGRRDLFKRMAEMIAPEDRIIWIHVASLGEFEQGRPIIEQIRSEKPQYKILLTFFSPSGYEIRKDYQGADYIFYMPLDTPRNARRFIEIAHPEVAIFVKYEFWLNHLRELKRKGIKTYIVSAIFRKNSIFFRPHGGMWRQALESFDTLFVQNTESKRLLSDIGFDNVVVAGDTRFDRVAQIASAAKRVSLVERFKGENRCLVAGSTWEPDEELLIDLMNSHPETKFIIAPHEINEERIEKLASRAQNGAIRYTKHHDSESIPQAQLLIIDTIGLLSSVYSYASLSYIGGGFGVGIHNTLEAATFGLPISFGPNFARFKEARDMVKLGSATPITNYSELERWFNQSPEELAKQARTSKDYTNSHQGATSTILKTIFTR